MFFNGFDSVKSVKICQINTSNNVLFKTMSIFIFLVNFCLSIFDLIYTYNPGHVTEKSKQLEWNSFTILKYPKKIWLEGNGLVFTFFRTQLFWNIHWHCIWYTLFVIFQEMLWYSYFLQIDITIASCMFFFQCM